MRPASRRSFGRLRAGAVAWCLAGSVACGGAAQPTAPSPPAAIEPDWANAPLELSPERYLLQLSGGDLTGDPTYPPCSPVLVPRAGKWVTTFLWFAWEGSELVGRPRPPYRSTLELRLRRVSGTELGVVIAGSVRGSAHDEYDFIQGERDSIFNVDGEVTVSGTIAPHAAGFVDGARLGGRFQGPTSFTDSTGALSQCTNVQYYLEVRRPGGLDDDPSVPPLFPGFRPAAIGAPAPPDGAGAPTGQALTRPVSARTP
jgi:hypothetical protein